MLFDLIKRVYDLNPNDKKYLHANLSEILNIIDQEEYDEQEILERTASGEHPLYILQESAKKKKKPIINTPHLIDNCSDPSSDERINDPSTYNPLGANGAVEKNKTSFKYKTANLYDPETCKHMLKVINLIEKFINLDDDFSCDNLGIFLFPLNRGAKRLALRPTKVVGLTKDLWSLARQYDRLNNSKEENPDFKSEIKLVKQNFRDKLSLLKEKLIETEEKG